MRADERRRLADLLEANADTLADFAGDKDDLVRLIALMLRLKG